MKGGKPLTALLPAVAAVMALKHLARLRIRTVCWIRPQSFSDVKQRCAAMTSVAAVVVAC